MRIPKTLRKAVISVVVLIVLFLAAGTLYTLFAGQPAPAKKTAAPAASAPDAGEVKPTAPAANAPVGVATTSLLSPVQAGSNTSLTIKTRPDASCSISVAYNGVASTDSGLAPKTADAYGTVNWTWTVGSTVPAGNWPINVSCAYKGRSAVLQTQLQVTAG